MRRVAADARRDLGAQRQRRNPVVAANTTLAALGRRRRGVLSLPHFIGAMSAVAASDLVARRAGQQTFEPPLEVPGFEMAMFWHERRHREPAHRWLREQMLAAVADRGRQRPAASRARSSSSAFSRSLAVIAAARSNSMVASCSRPSRASRSPRAACSRW